ncbi:hypothetical protein V5799_005852 [Amblyomma americanum]|uniref:Uncharacterized protein n=1 Tax=Amblyomma americanum TaxID=6943 RepID=A0AAQ4DY25_AMBAM
MQAITRAHVQLRFSAKLKYLDGGDMSRLFGMNLLVLVAVMIAALIMSPNSAEAFAVPGGVLDTISNTLGRSAEDMDSKK